MSDVRLSPEVPGETRLWRFMSLDKFIDLLSGKQLYLSPIAVHARLDPYEGLLPAAMFKSIADLLHKPPPPRRGEIGAALRAARATIDESPELREDGQNQSAGQGAPLFDFESHARQLPDAYTKAVGGIAINCWHANAYESDAMWSKYSEAGKGVAIETTAKSLQKSISTTYSNGNVYVDRVIYVDFYNAEGANLLSSERLKPIYKRKSFEHENEIRVHVHPDDFVDSESPQPVRLDVDLEELIKCIHVSPWAKAPFFASVVALVEAFGMKKELVKPSELLTGRAELLDLLKPFRIH